MAASVRVLPMPAQKLGDAYDAGAAVKATAPIMDADGYPAINAKTGNERLKRVRRSPSSKWISWTGTVMHKRARWGSVNVHDPNTEVEGTETMHKNKAIRYNTCCLRDSLSRRWIPREMRNEEKAGKLTACRDEDFGLKTAGKKYGFHQACPHNERVIAERTEIHNERQALIAEKFVPNDVKAEDQRRQDHRELMTVLANQVRGGGTQAK